MTSHYDAIIVGAGHNGLTCGAYLAKAGLRTLILERRDVVGGAALTETFHPGYRNSSFSYLVSLLDQSVIDELELQTHGLTLLHRPGGVLSLLAGDALHLPRDTASAQAAINRFSTSDAQNYPNFELLLDDMGALVRDIARTIPPNFGGGLGDIWRMVKLGNRFRQLPAQRQLELSELMTMSIGDCLERWFDSDAMQGMFGFEGVIGHFADPWTPGTAYVLLHHVFGEVDGRTGAWSYAKGGMGAIADAIAAAARSAGADIITHAEVGEITTSGGRVGGVTLRDGRQFAATQVAANTHPKILFGTLIDPAITPPEFARRVTRYRSESATFRMNVALSELPKFEGVEGEAGIEAMKNTINICPSLAYIQSAYDDARSMGWARKPIVSMCIPSLLDSTLAPEGCHVMSLFCQHFRRELPGDLHWDDVREKVADLIIDTVAAYSSNFKAAIVARQIYSPLDIERTLNMVGGDIFHGKLSLDQIFSLRPVAGYADHRMPVQGLYLCGAGAHPGGGVSGIPGKNAAQTMIRDARKR